MEEEEKDSGVTSDVTWEWEERRVKNGAPRWMAVEADALSSTSMYSIVMSTTMRRLRAGWRLRFSSSRGMALGVRGADSR